jgi:uncharacterized protein YdeI (BOF family)
MKNSIIVGAIVAIAASVFALTSGTAGTSRPSEETHSANNYFGPDGPSTSFTIEPPKAALS